MIRENIEQAIRAAAGDVPFVLERPADMAHGDYATNVALVAAKTLKKNPKEVAQELLSKLGDIEGVEKVEVAGAGFINFYLSRAALMPKEEKPPQLYTGKTVMVDYTQPNPFKPFHIGHLMSNTIGESLAHLLERAGAKVIRVNYQGDVGPHVAKAIWGIQKLNADPSDIDAIGKAYVLGTEAYENDPETKAAIDILNKKIYEQSDPAVNALYDTGRKASLEHFEHLYRVLGTKFDEYYFESQSWRPGLQLVREHIGDVFEESEGAIVLHGEKYGLNTRVFVTSQGLPTYDGKEIGLIHLKFEQYHPDLSIVETAVEQKNMFEVAFKAAELIDPTLNGKLKHIYHGMMRFASGKMSSRLGNVITGESLIKDLTEAARGREDVAVGAIKYAVLRQGSGKDITFDPEKSLSLEGDSGPYLQYARVRAKSLLAKIKDAGIISGIEDMPVQANALERVLVHYSDALTRAARELEPHYLTTFLTELASAFNSWYAQEKVIGGPHQHYGAFLTAAVEHTLREGLETLGIPVPEEM